MSTRPTYKRAATSSFSIPQVPARRIKLDQPNDSSWPDELLRSPSYLLEESRIDVTDTLMQYHGQLNIGQVYSEFPFPQQIKLQSVEGMRTPPTPDRLTLDTARIDNFTRMRVVRHDSWSSECSPLSHVSPMPSLADSEPWSPLSPSTPQTPADLFSTAAHSLQRLVMADDLGMTLDEIKELDKFAALSVSGSEKRSGRILPENLQRPTRQRPESVSSRSFSRRSSIRSDRKGSLPYSRPRLQSIEERTNQVDDGRESNNWWREVNWSRFSDSSSSSVSDDDMDIQTEEQTRRPAVKRRSSSYRGCIFLPDNHEHKIPYLEDVNMAS